jgi:hypothetical protein
MENINELKKQQSDIHPGFGSYLECMTRALFTGVAAFTLGNICYCLTPHFTVNSFV